MRRSAGRRSITPYRRKGFQAKRLTEWRRLIIPHHERHAVLRRIKDYLIRLGPAKTVVKPARRQHQPDLVVGVWNTSVDYSTFVALTVALEPMGRYRDVLAGAVSSVRNVALVFLGY